MNEILEELNRTINIAKRNPFYDEIQQVSSISEFEELPTLEKEELLKLKPEDFVRGYEGHLMNITKLQEQKKHHWQHGLPKLTLWDMLNKF